MTEFIFLVILGYLMGSISCAVIVCKSFSLPDPRKEGSKNAGATNVLRLAGKHYAAMVMVGDVLKGTIPVLIAKSLSADPTTIGFTALAAVLGHMYPIFFEFKGGKGVATALGALLGFQFMVGVVVAATWLAVANFSHYSSLASIVSMSLAPIYALMIVENGNIFPPLLIITLLILYKHRENINRLLDGVEPKIEFKRPVLEEFMEPATEISSLEPQPQPKPLKEKIVKVVKNSAKEIKKTPDKKVSTPKATTKEASKTSAKTTTKKASTVKTASESSPKKEKVTKQKKKKVSE